MPGPGLKLFFDGGCRPNPGPIEVAAAARGITYIRTGLPPGDNNDAEWLALLHALSVARSLGETDVVLIGDSALVIHQASGAWKCRSPGLQTHLAAFHAQAERFTRIRLRHVKRSHNLAGIALEALRR